MTEHLRFPSIPDIPSGGYKAVSGDPPWPYRDDLPGPGRGSNSHYDTLHPKTVAGMAPQIRKVTAPHAHLYLWTTNSFVSEAIEIAEEWGFTPKTLITWVKVHDAPETLPHERSEPVEVDGDMKMGHYTRGSTEHMIFAVKGRKSVNASDALSHFYAEVTEHSAKPEKAYRLIEYLSDGPYLDMFARDERDGWTAWGDEID